MEHLLFKAFLLAAVLTLFTILLTRKENSVTPINYLDTTGAASTKKLMVVDQTSGAISFLNDSVAGVNQKFLQNDATQAALLKELFGDKLDGTGGVFKAKIDQLVAAGGPIASKYETKANAAAVLTSLEGSIDKCVKNNDLIMIESMTDKRGGDNKRAVLQNTCGWAGNNDCDAKFMTNKTRPTSASAGDPHAVRHKIIKF